MRFLVLCAALAASSFPVFAETAQERLKEAAAVLREVMATPEQSIPDYLIERASCAVVVPGMKSGAFIVGAKYGRGFVTCRERGGAWGPPAAIRIEGGTFGLQIGGQATDVVMLVMNENGMKKLMESSFTLGGGASVAAGPVGQAATAQTDAYMGAEILSWSRSRGLFAGVNLQGATLRSDEDENKELYGRKMDTKEVLTSNLAVPPAAKE
ncbi:MAG: lipid-binding SYLF domain-containing protein, partial [Acidobacteria bacterium]|nr:lipid-binding SYLF domain-containing protein [Acidobacteriota bacterium]